MFKFDKKTSNTIKMTDNIVFINDSSSIIQFEIAFKLNKSNKFKI